MRALWMRQRIQRRRTLRSTSGSACTMQLHAKAALPSIFKAANAEQVSGALTGAKQDARSSDADPLLLSKALGLGASAGLSCKPRSEPRDLETT